MSIIRPSTLLLLCSAGLSPADSGHAQCSGYSVDVFEGPACAFLPSWAGNARAINNAGDMLLGYVDCAEVGHPVIWFANGEIVEIPPSNDPGYPGPLALNDVGEVAGQLNVEGVFPPLAFLYSNGITVNLGTLPGDSSAEAFGVSNNGRVVGYSTGCNPTCRYHAVLWQGRAITTLELPLGPMAIANNISSSGQYICGWMGEYPSTHFGGSHAFIWNDGIVTDLGTPDPKIAATEAKAVNNFGAACGSINYAEKFPTGYSRGFIWSDGKMMEIGVLPGFENSFAIDLNDAGQVLGICNEPGNEPFVWNNDIMVALDDLVPPELNLNIRYAWSINNAGQIAAQATRPGPNGQDTVALRLTPIPSPIGDSDCDKDIDVDDLLKVINTWGAESPKGSNALPPADFNHDGAVGTGDLMIVIDNWTM